MSAQSLAAKAVSLIKKNFDLTGLHTKIKSGWLFNQYLVIEPLELSQENSTCVVSYELNRQRSKTKGEKLKVKNKTGSS